MAILQKTFSDILERGRKQGHTSNYYKKSRIWYREQARRVSDVKSRDILKTRRKERIRQDIQLGDLVFFRYDPKTKSTLPYWDGFPLIFPFAETSTHFWGFNVHYLAPKERAILMDVIHTTSTNNKYDEQTKAAVLYDTMRSMSKFKYFKPTIKQYLKSHVRTRFIKIHANEWDMAVFLPTAEFHGASRQAVYADSRRIIRG